MRIKLIAVGLAALAAAGGLAACSSGSSGGSATSLTVWSEENDAAAVKATQADVAKFTKATGIKVKIVGIDENQFQQLVTSDAAAGTLPDVVGALPLDAVQYVASNDLINADANAKVVSSLGASTFESNALALTKYKGAQAAVPSDAFGNYIIYRKDLLAKANLPVPNTYANILKDAAALNTGGTAGITLATTPGDAFTEQSFQSFALPNNCQLVNNAGKVTLDSSECGQAFQLYTTLASKYSVRGNQDVDSTKATYFAGKAAMVVWSSYLLGDMAGLNNAALPTCPQCKADPAYLAKNSGFVSSFTGPAGSKPAQWGEIGSWTITKTANASSAEKFVEYMLGDGYTGWLNLSPQGKFPVRNGTASNPTQYVDAWKQLKSGVNKRVPLASVYPPDVITAIESTPKNLDQWALTQGQGKLIGATLGPLPVPKALNAAINGTISPQQAAKQAQQAVEQIQAQLK